MNIAVDIDDTLTDSFDYFMPFAAEFFKTDISVLNAKNISYSNLPDEWKKDEIAFCKRYYDRYTADTPFKKDAAKGIKRLKDLGHKIIIITGRTTDFYTDPYKTTRKELENGGIIYDKLICTLDKAKACREEKISVLVDDLAANCSAAKNAGVFPVLFVSRANKNERCDFCKAESWEDVVKIISKL